MMEPTFADILAQAFASAEGVATHAPSREVAPDHGTQAVAYLQTVGLSFAFTVADHYCADFEELWDALCYVPDDMLKLLDTPAGWSELAAHIAQGVRIERLDPLTPSIH